MRGSLKLALAVALAAALPVQAQVYSWTDAEGRLHFTSDLQSVPSEHREEARRRAREKPDAGNVQFYSAPASPTPPSARSTGRTLRIPFQRHGTLMRLEAELNGWLETPLLVDTGASGIAIPQHVADRLGLRVGPETRWIQTHTANGVVARPVVTLDSVRVGEAVVEHLDATINPTLDVGLLGGSFFNNFVYRVDAADRAILLTPNDRIRRGLTEAEWRERFTTLRDAIARIDAYVPRLAPSQDERRAELAAQRRKLVEQLEALELEANRAKVPYAWRD